ncbi:MAG TPA: MurR/RpiR family transcriptional regulator [Bordetella sp.]
MTASDTIEARIQQHYPELSGADRKLADVLMMQDRQMATYSATELAALAGVSKASMARFIRRLGFEDFNAFRLQARRQVSTDSPLYLMQQDSAQHSLAQHVQADIARLQALTASVSEADIDRCVALLVRARRVWIAGFRNSHMTAFYAHTLLATARADVRLLNDSASRYAELMADVAAGDLLLAMDFRRSTHRIAQIAAIAAESGADLIVLTDAAESRLAGLASVALRCPNPGSPVFYSYAAAASLVNLLAMRVIGQTREAAHARAARIEHIHQALDDLDPHD